MSQTQIVPTLRPEPDAVRLVDLEHALRYRSIPLRRDGSRLTVAMENPLDLGAIAEMEFMTGLRIVPIGSTGVEIERALGLHYPRLAVPARASKPNASDVAGDSPVVRLQRLLLREAAGSGASDIHIDPHARWTRVRYRIDGALRDRFDLPKWVHSSLLARIKVMARLDISERRLPQDGLLVDAAEGVEARVATTPTERGEAAVIRLFLDRTRTPSLDDLGGGETVASELRAICNRPQGIVVVAGPTGSGKTTTLYAIVQELRQRAINIVTIEDPVEYRVDGVRQIRVDAASNLTFHTALRSVLRQDPDVILLGEIRDRETAETAFNAALTGHLVLTTVHATDAVSVVVRLNELGVDPRVVATALVGVLAQRLVRTNCRSCLRRDHPLPFYSDRLGLDDGDHLNLGRGAGCPECSYTGFSGRMPFFEILELDGGLRSHLMRTDPDRLRRAASESGFVTIFDQVMRQVRRGAISVEEAYRTCYFGGDR